MSPERSVTHVSGTDIAIGPLGSAGARRGAASAIFSDDVSIEAPQSYVDNRFHWSKLTIFSPNTQE